MDTARREPEFFGSHYGHCDGCAEINDEWIHGVKETDREIELADRRKQQG